MNLDTLFDLNDLRKRQNELRQKYFRYNQFDVRARLSLDALEKWLDDDMETEQEADETYSELPLFMNLGEEQDEKV